MVADTARFVLNRYADRKIDEAHLKELKFIIPNDNPRGSLDSFCQGLYCEGIGRVST